MGCDWLFLQNYFVILLCFGVVFVYLLLAVLWIELRPPRLLGNHCYYLSQAPSPFVFILLFT
jgi:hypothetical protein